MNIVESNIAKTWMDELARTAKDYDAHMDLISKRVKVHGLPGIELIEYQDWAAQCKHEFENNVLKRFSYDGIKVQVMTSGRVMFNDRRHRRQHAHARCRNPAGKRGR